MFLKVSTFAYFSHQPHANLVSKKSKFKNVHLDKWHYLKGDFPRMLLDKKMDELISLAPTIGMTPREMEVEIVRVLEGEKFVAGLKCRDGYMVHPEALMRVIKKLVKQWIRRTKKELGQEYAVN